MKYDRKYHYSEWGPIPVKSDDDYPSPWDDEEPGPVFDPQIQADYEASLGKFLVAFNQIEKTVTDIIVLALHEVGREDILRPIYEEMFARKVLILDLLSLRFPEVASKDLTEELRALNTERNDLAHGHLDVNPFDGSLQIRNCKNKLKKGRQNLPVETVRQLTVRAKGIYSKLRHSEATLQFSGLEIQNDLIKSADD